MLGLRTLHHLCIQTDRYEESVKFYCDILGFEIIKESPNFHGRFYNSWLQQGDMRIELQTNRPEEELINFNGSNKGIIHFCLLVDDIYAEYSRIKALGFNNFKAKNGGDVYTVENGKLMKLIAPEGTIVEIRDQADL